MVFLEPDKVEKSLAQNTIPLLSDYLERLKKHQV